jgi:predicted outer membrane repeat protein
MKTHLLYFFTIIFSFTLSAQTTSYYVKAGGANVAGGGLSEAAAFSTVSYAVGAAVDGDKIIVVGSINHPGQVAVDKSLTFEGQTDAVITSTNTEGKRMFALEAAANGKSITFKNITLQNANSSFQGAVFSLTGTNTDLIIDNCTFLNNTTTNNGGVILAAGTGNLTISNSLFNGNSALRGGVVSVTETGRKLTVSQSTFVNNTASSDGGVMYLGGGNTESSITNSTFFNNSFTGGTNQSKGGALRIENARPFTIANCLIYGNIATNGTNTANSDLGLQPAVILSLVNSLTKKIVTAPAEDDTYNTSIIEADLSASNLRFDAIQGKVIYDNVAVGVHSPIDFGSDGNDAGSWDSGYTLSFEHLDKKDVLVFYQKQTKSLFVQHSANNPLKIDVYNVLGAKVMSKFDIEDNESIDVSSLKSGVYFVLLQNKNNAITKKVLIQ